MLVTGPRGMLERDEVVVLAAIIGGIVVLAVLFVVFRSTNEVVSGTPGASESSRTVVAAGAPAAA